jgi:uncharacterized damage-inducible protein DinB
MDLLQHLRRLLAYDEWANREVLASLRRSGAPPPRSLQIFAHILAAERLWYDRLTGRKQEMAVWPELTLGECEPLLDEQSRLWGDYLRELTPDRLTERISYTNTKGEAWTSAIQDVLFHIVFHSAYHRGQIATGLGATGRAPAYTDFIHAARQDLLG